MLYNMADHKECNNVCFIPHSGIVPLQLEFNDLSLHECLRHHGVGVALPSKVAVTDL